MNSGREHRHVNGQRRVDKGKGREVGSPLLQPRYNENAGSVDSMSFMKVPLTGKTIEQANHAPNPPDAPRYEGPSVVAAPLPRAFNPLPRWMTDLGPNGGIVSHLPPKGIADISTIPSCHNRIPWAMPTKANLITTERPQLTDWARMGS